MNESSPFGLVEIVWHRGAKIWFAFVIFLFKIFCPTIYRLLYGSINVDWDRNQQKRELKWKGQGVELSLLPDTLCSPLPTIFNQKSIASRLALITLFPVELYQVIEGLMPSIFLTLFYHKHNQSRYLSSLPVAMPP